MPQSTTDLSVRVRSYTAHLWTRVLTLVAGLLVLTVARLTPSLHQHPFALLYTYVVAAVWWGALHDGLLAVLVSIVGSTVLLERFGALPLEEVLFALASVVLLILIDRLRRERLRAETAQVTAEDALQVRDHILAAASHDLKSPLVAITGQVQLLQHRVQRGDAVDPARLAHGLEQIERATTRMTRLINELLDAAQLQAGQTLDLDRHPIDLVALTGQVVSAQQQVPTGHQIVIETARPQITGTWDAFRLERVLDNLLSNALKYSPAGSTITVRVQPEGVDGVTLTVQDQGRGIPVADLPYIFERFHRAGNARGTRGTGLGLAGSRAIIEQHGGTLTLESQEGVGTTVRVQLPRSAVTRSDVISAR